MTENKKVKDNLFVDLFCSDQDGTRNFLSLYNALHNTNLKFDEVKIEPKRIEQVMYRTLSNDVAMEINDKLIVMVEQQSTINKNMPLRFVMYISRLYESFVEEKDKYRRTLVEIPTPEFYVIYNGQDNYPKESILQLSDAFKDKSIDIQLDLKVTVYNVNKYRDLDIVQQCRAMNDYCKFIDLINYEKSNGVKTDRYKHAI
ncbi:MAG: PD-(D/E)XK nuclease family transposase, partial [Spirochaetales bacterium]|nr:PD-(D/E)XK nuclease family transposase [Spirochaetales bacterium]